MKRGFLNASKPPKVSTTAPSVRTTNVTVVPASPSIKRDGSTKPVALPTGFKLQKDPIARCTIGSSYVGQICTPTTLPAKGAPGGHTECMIPASLRDAILALPGFPRPPQVLPKMYDIVDIPGRGKGLVASCLIKAGTLIVDERPLLVSLVSFMPDVCEMMSYPFTREQMQRIVFAYNEHWIASLVDRMDNDRRRAFLSLTVTGRFPIWRLFARTLCRSPAGDLSLDYDYDYWLCFFPVLTLDGSPWSHWTQSYCFIVFSRTLRTSTVYLRVTLTNVYTHDGSGPLYGRSSTNRWQINGLPGCQPGNPYDQFFGVCDTLSRVNHSCSPNALVEWEMSSFSENLTAVRDIQPGEEITAAYVGLYSTYADRADHLRSGYDMACTCPACQRPAESDQRRRRVTRLRHSVSQFPSWNDTAQLDTMIRASIELMHNIELEGLQSDTELYFSAAKQAFNAYVALGDLETAYKYARQVIVAAKLRNASEKQLDSFEKSTSMKRLAQRPHFGKGKHLIREIRGLLKASGSEVSTSSERDVSE